MRVLLFTGKGGVGKTTLAAATAARLARDGRKTLVVSTDPAHSLADALGIPLSTEPSEVDTAVPLDVAKHRRAEAKGQPASAEDQRHPLAGNLFGCQLDPRALVDGAWQELRDHLHTVLAGAGVDELAAEELTVLPGVEDLLTLAEVHRLAVSGAWETVVVDCGPTAETLRLLALPDAVSGYLERMFPTHRRVVRGLLAGLAGNATIERWDAAAEALGRLAAQLDALRYLLTDPGTASVRVVCTPERVVAAETRRTLTALAVQGIHVDGVVANRLLPKTWAGWGGAAEWLKVRRREQHAVLAELAGLTVPVRTVEYHAEEPIGIAELLTVADELYGADDPLAGSPPEQRMAVSGEGTGLDAEYQLRLAIPIDTGTKLDLARVHDDLVITVDGQRRLIALPSVLRRCVVHGAAADAGGLTVRFRPDPRLWMRG